MVSKINAFNRNLCISCSVTGPFYIVYCIPIVLVTIYDKTAGDILNLLLSFFVLPVFTINLYRKQTVGSYFEFSKLKDVMSNLGDYLAVMIKQYVLLIVFLILSIPCRHTGPVLRRSDIYRKFLRPGSRGKKRTGSVKHAVFYEIL